MFCQLFKVGIYILSLLPHRSQKHTALSPSFFLFPTFNVTTQNKSLLPKETRMVNLHLIQSDFKYFKIVYTLIVFNSCKSTEYLKLLQFADELQTFNLGEEQGVGKVGALKREHIPQSSDFHQSCIFFLLAYNCFTMLCQFLLHNKVNQQFVYLYPLSLGPPSQPHPLSHLSRSSQSTKLSYLCYTAGSHQLSILHMVVYLCQT